MKKTQKGITLVALILTIVVLLILAVVAITAIQNTAILEHANNAATQYNQKQEEENTFLNEYENFLNNYMGNGGTAGGKTYTAYTMGQAITYNGEQFYVLKDSDKTKSTVELLAKYLINISDLEQATGLDGENSIHFSETNYWSSAATKYPYDLTETGVPDESHYAERKAYDYGVKMEANTGRLMTYEEVNNLLEHENGPSIVYEVNYYYLGTAYDGNNVWEVAYSSLDWDGYAGGTPTPSVRPVIEISKDLLS